MKTTLLLALSLSMVMAGCTDKPNWRYPIHCDLKGDASYYPIVGYKSEYWITDSSGATYCITADPHFMQKGQTLFTDSLTTKK